MQFRKNQKERSVRLFGADITVYLPFLIAAIVSLVYHIKIQPMGGDDPFFAQATEGTTIWEYLAGRYENWTSRIVLEFILVLVVKLPWLWKILDFLAFATLPWLMSRLLGGGKLMNWCAAFAVLIYPFHDMGTAGWITTTETHFWPLWGILFVAVLLRKIVMKERILIPEAVFGVLVCMITGSHEQYAVILLVLLLLSGFYLLKKRQKPGNLPLFVLISGIDILSLVVIMCCPGNAGRNAVSIADLPVYETFGFGDKLYLGLLSIERVFIANSDIVFFSVVLLMAVLVYLKTESYIKTVISGLPLLILFGQTVVRTAYPGLSGLFPVPGQILEWSWSELSTWLPMVYLAITVGAMIYAFYQMFGENLMEYIYILILLGCGFGAGAVLGFMATIYVSGERVYAALYMILLLVIMAGIKKQQETVQETLKRTGGKLFVTFMGLLCLINIGFLFLSV